MMNNIKKKKIYTNRGVKVRTAITLWSVAQVAPRLIMGSLVIAIKQASEITTSTPRTIFMFLWIRMSLIQKA